MSSWLPWATVSEDSVEDGQELSRDGDEGDHFGLAGGDEAVEEGLQDGVVAFGDHRAHEQGRAHGDASSGDEAAAAPLAGWAGERGQAGKRGDRPAAELPELGQLSDQRAGNGRPNARHGSEQILLVSPSWRAAHGIVDILIDAGQLLLQRFKSRAMLLRRWGTAIRFSRWRSAPIISMICRRRATRSASSRVALSGNGRVSGLFASAKRAMTAASIGSVLARCPSALAKDRICAGLTTTIGSPAAANATICGAICRNRVARRSNPAASRSTTNASLLGQTATSRRSFDTSIPTVIMSIATRPCLIGLRARRPRRPFGFDGTTSGAPSSPTAFKHDPGAVGLPPVTATSLLSESRA